MVSMFDKYGLCVCVCVCACVRACMRVCFFTCLQISRAVNICFGVFYQFMCSQIMCSRIEVDVLELSHCE